MSPSQRAFEDLERLRRSIAMLAPGQPALDREKALTLLAEMQDIRRDLDQLERGLRSSSIDTTDKAREQSSISPQFVEKHRKLTTSGE